MHLAEIRSLKKFLIACWLILALNSLAKSEDNEQHLVVGNPKNLFFSYNIGDIHIGNPAVCNFNPDRENKKVTLVPVAEGETRLIIYDDKGKQRDVIKITVFSHDLDQYSKELGLLFKEIDGIQIRRVGTKIVIEGEVYFTEDLDTIKAVTGENADIVNRVRLSQDIKRILAQKIKKEIGEPDIEASVFYDKLILKGRVYNQSAADRAVKLAKLYWDPPIKVVDVLEIVEEKKKPERSDTIQITAHYIELNKMLNQNFLFKWTPFPDAKAQGIANINPQTGSSQITGTIVAQFTDLIPRLNYMKSLGIVRVMENPTVSVTDGNSATLKSGSKILVPVAQPEGGAKIEPQVIGVEFTVTPRKILNEIDLDIQFHISALGTPAASGMLSIDYNDVSTKQIIRSGESVVIGGILRTSTSNIRDRQPPAEEAPPGLFTLFKTKDFAMHRAQFMVFITPRIYEFAKDANNELKDYFNLYEVFPMKTE